MSPALDRLAARSRLSGAGAMGGEPLLRPDIAHRCLLRGQKGFWIYIGTNGRLLRPEVADR